MPSYSCRAGSSVPAWMTAVSMPCDDNGSAIACATARVWPSVVAYRIRTRVMATPFEPFAQPGDDLRHFIGELTLEHRSLDAAEQAAEQIDGRAIEIHQVMCAAGVGGDGHQPHRAVHVSVREQLFAGDDHRVG